MSTQAAHPAPRSRWMDWKPKGRILEDCAQCEPSIPSKPGPVASRSSSEGFEGTECGDSPKITAGSDGAKRSADGNGDLGTNLRGKAIELWSDAAGGRLFIVADERDAALLNERRGEVLTADELRLVVKITDPKDAAEVLRWKRTFDGRLSEGERPK